MNVELIAELENARQSILSTYQLALTYGDQKNQDSQMYLDFISQLSEIENNARVCENALDEAKETARTVEEFQQKYNVLLQQKKKFDAKKTAAYKGFQNKLKALYESAVTKESNSLSEDIHVVVEDDICTVDPWTKQQMQNPVRNTICGHRYEKTSIMAKIKAKERITCPVVGCGKNSLIKAGHLVDDNEFKLRLQEMRQQKEN